MVELFRCAGRLGFSDAKEVGAGAMLADCELASTIASESGALGASPESEIRFLSIENVDFYGILKEIGRCSDTLFYFSIFLFPIWRQP